ncbi:histidine ammonia-lyase [Streptomyces albus]|uniref:Histidine ammonia-lyase n=1 Tax=Streptomyces albus (strain ATCC 21838 / DSM 41398 / FERM P-419 / JCM 4703 / NBRC 107858) TaxID=1081613 RepID=A0A0B5F1H6_STRA4|nr:histidine ammonia-lyase [Streptomyces albus]AOU79041.1 histidine ammonia-lyase [Streptomyces albus]AYN34776.1 histidine ammonia-lyase [Streptomyces albus]
MTRPTRVVLDGRTLSYAEVVAVAEHGAGVALEDGVLPRLTRERAVVDDAVDRRVPVYGLTTGLGSRASYALPREELAEFSVRTVRGRANAVGDPLPVPLVRAAVLARVNGLAGGGSGVRPEIPRLLVAMLNARVHPVIPETGSIGASDLCQLAHVGLVVIGEGRAEFGGELLDGGTALRRAGLAPAVLGPKDGPVLCGASPLAAGQGALVLHEAAALLTLAQAVTALTYEGFRANTSPLDPRVLRLRPAPGQSRAAAELLALLDGGALNDPRQARRVQDPLSLRCAAQVHGALHTALDFADAALRPELNGCGDNPVVVAGGYGDGSVQLPGGCGDDPVGLPDSRSDDPVELPDSYSDDPVELPDGCSDGPVEVPGAGGILSSGNFHTPALALAFDTLALALTQTASLSAERMRRLLTPAVSGLPANLSPYGPERSGFAPLTKTAQSLVAEIRMLSVPVCTDPRHGADAVEDDSTNASLGARRLATLLVRLRQLLAVEALVAAQAVDLAAPPALGRGPRVLHRAIRAVVPPLDDDRGCGVDVTVVEREVLGSEEVRGAVGEMVGGVG